MKRCSKCDRRKPKTLFYRARAARDGRSTWCKRCARKYRVENYDAEKAARRRWRAENRAHEREINRTWQEANKHRLPGYRRTARLKRYNLTLDEYNALLKKQKGLCAVCRKKPDERFLAVDHNHRTGRVRGLVHRRCNTAIALLREDPVAAKNLAAYLRRHGAAV